MTNMEPDIQSLVSENTELRDEVSHLTHKINSMESQAKRNNVIFYNVEGHSAESFEDTLDAVTKVMTETMNIKYEDFAVLNVRRLPSKVSGPKPVLVTFAQPNHKSKVMMGAKYLKSQKISVSHDFTDDERNTRRKLKPLKDKARHDGCFSVMRYTKLQIDNKL
ncbi:uncharacterized protein [Haliotis cracherodii]|uniref:uncharacterized protein n=1 Tax=Haliotis cracherodii TaxID=6455 RepID=UPI0039E7B413